MQVEVGIHALKRHDPERGVYVVAIVVTQPPNPPIVACEVLVCDRCGQTTGRCGCR